MTQATIAGAVRLALLTEEPAAKVMATRAVARNWRGGRLAPEFDVVMPDCPARPARPELLPPARMPKRGRGQSLRGRIALLHALAHIEYVAIDLALDMAGRFGSEMGTEFVSDFLAVAADEAMHFVLLDRRLRQLGSHYGALPAHNGLWTAAIRTKHDVAARLAVVPLVLEARALDVTPMTIERMRIAGDETSARILERILDDEMRHVSFGAKHFKSRCADRGEIPEKYWQSLVRTYFSASLGGPFNDSARSSAGLPREFYGELA